MRTSRHQELIMKPVISLTTLMLAAFPAIAVADDQVYYCNLDDYGYQSPGGSGGGGDDQCRFQICIDNVCKCIEESQST
jgi:hypothetical protein